MRFQLGIPMCLLAGCALQPTGWTAPDRERPAIAATASLQALTADTGGEPRIGLEFLPPDPRLHPPEPVRVEGAAHHNPVASRSERAVHTVSLPAPEPSPLPRLDELDFDAIDDPIARETLHFCSDLIATDQQRVRREAGIPFFGLDWHGPDDGLLASDRRRADERHRWLQSNGRRLLNRPLQLLGKRLPIVSEVQVAFEQLRSYLPLTRPYNDSHQNARDFGRLSLRLHVREVGDPVEVVYIHDVGIRLGTSRLRGKVALDFDLGKAIGLAVRARTDYRTGDTGLRCDLAWRPTNAFGLHLAAGDDLDFLATASAWSMFESPIGSHPGMVLYAVHTF